MASSEEQLNAETGDKWDSGKVESDNSVNVPYEGAPLASAEKCWWKVRVWDENDQAGPWSEPATFEMGLLDHTDWQGKWIGAPADVSAPLLRKEFGINDKVKRARVYVAGIGYHELRINGQEASANVMSPAPTYYDNILPFDIGSRVLYLTYDITALLKEGGNAMGVMLGNGWYSSDDGKPAGRTPFAEGPSLLLQINIELAGGETISVTTDDSWKTSRSPITANDIAAGEHYDARLEQPGWDRPGFDESTWAAATEIKAPRGQLVSQSVEATKITQRLKPTRMMKSADGSFIFDMGQYISGWVELRVEGPKGTKIALCHAGRVNYETARLDSRNNRSGIDAAAADRYILKGEGIEVWHPKFTIHGFRYVEVIGYPGEPTLESVVGCAVNSDVPVSGTFKCSNDLLNRIHRNVCSTFRGSFQGIPQDAADRAERVAWLGDPGFVAEDYMVNFADVRFWSKWLDDIRDSQTPEGQVSYLAPPNWGEACYEDWPCWECSYSLFVWFVYRYYDDTRVLERHYDGIKKQVERFGGLAKEHILDERLGDHMEPRRGFGDRTSSFEPTRTPPVLCGTAYYQRCAWIVAQAAGILGHEDDAAKYSALADTIKDAFNAKFFDPETHQYAEGSQTSNALPLQLDLVPAGHEEAVVANLVDDIEHKWGGHLSTGIIGTDALEQALPRYGRADVMYGIATQTTFPGWGYGVTLGQTTISEDFECSDHRSVSMKMFGSIEKFFYKDVAGIGLTAPGYRTIAFRPQLATVLDHAAASIKTVRGLAAIAWTRDEHSIHMRVTVPTNASGAVSVPTLGLGANIVITEGDREIWANGAYVKGAEGVVGAAAEKDFVTFEAGSGCYSFKLTRGEKRSG
ncbi:family 78 glycoside hydrolase catalytic domain [Candidatus Sumerlaeota bacterium]